MKDKEGSSEIVMKVHYFQRYHDKENVATANAVLLLSRLYAYSTKKFYQLLRNEFFEESYDPEISFDLQVKSGNSIPDATITQEGFKIIVETKLSDWFYLDQLQRHLQSSRDTKHIVLITLAPEPMSKDKLEKLEQSIKEYNGKQKQIVLHKNMTFDDLVNAVQKVLDDRDYEMQEILDDYLDYCINDSLILKSDAWKYLYVYLAGDTFDYNVREKIYYNGANRRFREHEYLGLYKEKSIRAIGKICARITAVETEKGIINYTKEHGELTEERREKIRQAMEDGRKLFGYDLKTYEHRYFFVEEFYETDFKKITPRAPMGSRVFDLSAILDCSVLPNIKEIAEHLRTQVWL